MSLFQKYVLNKHLNAQDDHKVLAAFEKLEIYQANEKSISEYKEERNLMIKHNLV
jgi:arginyl-tRNA--protein-N-Asp/Glu arginylyltransferase